MANPLHVIRFMPSGRGQARCPSNPAYPRGIALPLSPGVQDSCFIVLPYPAIECGVWMVTCPDCGCTAAITAAGRADDPISFYMPCLKKQKGNSNEITRQS